MRRYTYPVVALLFVCIVQVHCFGQRIVAGARDEFSIQAGINFPMGEETYAGSPALLANMKPGYSVDLRYTTTLLKNFQVGAWAGTVKFNGWNSTLSPLLYEGSTMKFLSFGPALMYKPWSPKDVGLNRFGFCILATPGASIINIETAEEASINDGTNPETLTVKSTRLTVGLHAGLSYICSSTIGVNLLAGYRYTQSESKIFPDKNYSFLNVSAAVFYRLHLDKRYKYAHL